MPFNFHDCRVDDLSWDKSDPTNKVFVRFSNIGYDFVPTYGMQITKGRNFSKDYPADREPDLVLTLLTENIPQSYALVR